MKAAARVRPAARRAPTTPRLLAFFDAADPVIAALVRAAGPCRLGRTRRDSCFEMLVRSIASQQLSGIVAAKILGRLEALYGGRFPTPAELAAAEPTALRAVGFSFAKIAALHDLAARRIDGRLPDDAALGALDDEAVIAHCVEGRGIGRWTAEMLLMFELVRPDVLPVDDFGVRNGFRLAYGLKGMPTPRALREYGERWRPWRSAASWYLWRAVDLDKAGTLPAPPRRRPRVAITVPRPPP
jgi:DNA-3-methyladenine glycosylase II